MRDTTSRLFGLLCVLVAVWVVTYWLYKPSSPATTRDDRPPAGTLPAGQPTAGSPEGSKPADITPPSIRETPPSPQPTDTRGSPAPQQVLIPPKFREYIVERGDTGWEVIAEKTLKDRKLWKAISQANPLVTPDRLIPGRTVLKIPLDPENIQGKVVTVAPPPAPQPPPASGTTPEAGAGQPTPPAPTPAPPQTPPERTYTIQDGDTLWNIAKKFYGKGSLWPVIFEANKSVIKDSDSPVAGVAIRIPPQP